MFIRLVKIGLVAVFWVDRKGFEVFSYVLHHCILLGEEIDKPGVVSKFRSLVVILLCSVFFFVTFFPALVWYILTHLFMVFAIKYRAYSLQETSANVMEWRITSDKRQR